MNTLPLEIEYKYLIAYPDISKLQTMPEYRCEHLTQLYLSIPSENSVPQNCRIRKTVSDSGVVFTKTQKQDLGGITRIEIENEISEEEYLDLSRFIRDGYRPIEKSRHSFRYDGRICEVDVFPFWDDKAFLEIEVDSADIIPNTPDFLVIIRDVSTDRAFRNSSLARQLP